MSPGEDERAARRSAGSLAAPDEVTDGRLARGLRTRRTVLRAAVDVASAEGLEGLSFGRLAVATGLSKAGIQAQFTSKESLQLATAEFASDLFVDAVVVPAARAAEGRDRLRALVRRWLDYVKEPVFAGGCFWTATLAEFDSRPGPVGDLLFRQRADWLAVLEAQAKAAVAAGEVARQNPAQLAFVIDAVLHSTNLDVRRGDTAALARGRRVVDGLLSPA